MRTNRGTSLLRYELTCYPKVYLKPNNKEQKKENTVSY